MDNTPESKSNFLSSTQDNNPVKWIKNYLANIKVVVFLQFVIGVSNKTQKSHCFFFSAYYMWTERNLLFSQINMRIHT